MLDEVSYIFKVIITKKHPKLIFRELVCHWNFVSSQWVVPNEIWYAIDKKDIVTAQQLLDKQKEIWDNDDLEIMRAQSFIDMEG
jgi:hypothetical protein